MDRRIARAVAMSIVVPGLAHLVYARRAVEGALLLTFTFLWGVLGVIMLATFFTHIAHVGDDAVPGLIAQFILYIALLPVIGVVASVGLVDSMRRST